MILFRPEHVEPIIVGDKTQTRRLWERCRAKVGSEHLFYTRPPFCNPPGKPFAHSLILRTWYERLGDISPADARAEGYPSVEDYLEAFLRINRLKDTAGLVFDFRVWAVEFRCLADLRERETPR